MKRLRDHVFLNVAAETTLGIQSRIHMADHSPHVVSQDLKFEHFLVDMPAQHMMSQTFASQLDPRVTYTVERNGRFLQGIPGDLVQKMYEDDTIEQHIPWLDGAREYLMNLAVWAEGG